MKRYLLPAFLLCLLSLLGCSAKTKAPDLDSFSKLQISLEDRRMFADINAFLNICGVEGPQQTRGYIPCRPSDFTGLPSQNPDDFTAIGSSGVTIATGVDLGVKSVRSLKRAGVPDQRIEKLRPYVGKSNEQAIAALAENPLRITKEEANELDICEQIGEYKTRILPVVKDVEALPRQAQAVIFSLCYQCGVENVERRGGCAWTLLMKHDWKSAAQELIYGLKDSPYQYRRTMEGLLLVELLWARPK